eukprot:scaffold26778_cov10-Tisochrysis_lutea.AAC.1
MQGGGRPWLRLSLNAMRLVGLRDEGSEAANEYAIKALTCWPRLEASSGTGAWQGVTRNNK